MVRWDGKEVIRLDQGLWRVKGAIVTNSVESCPAAAIRSLPIHSIVRQCMLDMVFTAFGA